MGYVVRRFGGRAPVFEALSKKAQGFNRASERQEFLRTAGGLFRFGALITEAVDEALAAYLQVKKLLGVDRRSESFDKEDRVNKRKGALALPPQHNTKLKQKQP